MNVEFPDKIARILRAFEYRAELDGDRLETDAQPGLVREIERDLRQAAASPPKWMEW